MAKGPAPQPWQRAVSNTPPPSSSPPPPVVGDDGTIMKHTSAANPPAPAPPPPPPIPTDPKGFQQYLKDHGANLGKTGPKKDGVDGNIGPKTLAEAARLGIQVPPNLVPPAPTPVGSPTPPQQSAPVTQTVEDSSPTVVVPRATVDEIKARYGYMFGAILDQPDVAAVVASYDSSTESDDQFLARVQNTQTFQTHNQNELDWMKLRKPDQDSLIASQKAEIAKQAQSQGVPISDDRLTQIATDSLKFKWGSAQLANAISAEFSYKPGAQTGKIGQAERTLKQMAASYLMPLSDDTLAQWDAQIAGGADPESFRQTMINVAKGRFPFASKLLDQGSTLADIVEPYRQTAASTLGINPDTIDFSDPKWSTSMVGFDPKQGQNSLLSDFDFQRKLKTDPAYGWQSSEPGKADARLMAFNMLKELGKVA